MNQILHCGLKDGFRDTKVHFKNQLTQDIIKKGMLKTRHDTINQNTINTEHLKT